MKFEALPLFLALGCSPDLTGTPTSVHQQPHPSAQNAAGEEKGEQKEGIQPVEAQAAEHADKMEKEASGIFQALLAENLINSAQATELVRAAKEGDEAATDRIIEEVSESGHEDFNKLTLLISAVALLWFANMIRGCLKGKEISFIQHHIPFVVGLAAMATQAPGHVAHGLQESAAAFVVILVISRVSRGITNKIDFTQLSEEQAKTVLVAIGPLASLITTPAASTVLAPLKDRLTSEREKYIAMHGVSNVDGGLAIGDFPFFYVWMQKGVLAGSLWQAELMFPIMFFHKLMQAIYLKVGPAQIWKHKATLLGIVKGFSFDASRLTDSHDIHSEEVVVMRKFLEHVKKELARLKAELPTEVVTEVEKLIESQEPALEDMALGHGEGTGTQDSSEQLARLEALQREIEEVISDPKNISEALNVLQHAMSDGRITREELDRFKEAGHLHEIVKKLPGFKGLVKELESSANNLYARICEKLKFSHNEMEIGRVFTAQALAIGLLIPAVAGVLHAAPGLTEPVTILTSGTADNYAATAITWATHNAKALSLSILAGALTIFGNMANLNFLGKDAHLMASIVNARFMFPTLTFAVMATNDVNIGVSAVGGLAVAGATKGVEAARDRFKARAQSAGTQA